MLAAPEAADCGACACSRCSLRCALQRRQAGNIAMAAADSARAARDHPAPRSLHCLQGDACNLPAELGPVDAGGRADGAGGAVTAGAACCQQSHKWLPIGHANRRRTPCSSVLFHLTLPVCTPKPAAPSSAGGQPAVPATRPAAVPGPPAVPHKAGRGELEGWAVFATLSESCISGD